MAEDIPIVTGDPLQTPGGASFTCFVLPFRYKPHPLSYYDAKNVVENDKPYYQPIPMHSHEWISRERYFTAETAKVLFENTKWLVLPDNDWEKLDYPKFISFYNSNRQKMTVRIHPPRLILYEWQVNPENRSRDILDLFHTGFLVVKASFLQKRRQISPSYRDLLHFNELFRYWRVPFQGHKVSMEKSMRGTFWNTSKDFYFRRWQELLQLPLMVASDSAVYRLFPESWDRAASQWWSAELEDLEYSVYDNKRLDDSGWICHSDTRAFVWSCAIIKNGANALKQMNNSEISDDDSPINLGGWIKFLNVDLPGELEWINKATVFEKEWGKGRFYDRWLHYGTLYGFNYHAGVMLAGPCDDPPIVHHFHDHYFDMTLLLLYLRITLFRFSRELTRLSAEMRGTPDFKKEHREEFKILRREFAIFTNLYQFPLISNQQQAIEMYELIRKRMDIEELFKEVEEEIRSSHEYFQFEEEAELNKKIHWLTIVGAILAFIGVIATVASIPDTFEYFRDIFAEKEPVNWPVIPYPPSPKTP